VSISFDQTINCFLSLFFPKAWAGAWADETLSSRAWRMYSTNKPWGKFWRPIIDALFFWQKQPKGINGHCHGAYVKEKARYNLPVEMR
jgi:hypothetical protein